MWVKNNSGKGLVEGNIPSQKEQKALVRPNQFQE